MWFSYTCYIAQYFFNWLWRLKLGSIMAGTSGYVSRASMDALIGRLPAAKTRDLTTTPEM